MGDVDDIKAHQAAVEIGMTRTSDSCNQNDKNTATDRLRECLKALALSLVQRSSFQEVTFHLRDLRQMQRFLKKKGKLKLPLWTPTEATVYTVWLDNNRPGHHRAPDPLFLLVKAAIVWSVRQGQRLLPACGDGESDLDEQAL